MQLIDWGQTAEWVASKDATLAASFVGVPQTQIDAVQAEYRITFPSAYVGFLRTMGESSGGLTFFGATQTHTFSRLLARLPPEGYPSTRFFKVAFESDRFALVNLHTYLDLARSDGNDAALVTFETPLDPDQIDSPEEPLSFAETVVFGLFWMVDVVKRQYGSRIVVFGEKGWNSRPTKRLGMDLLEEAGFQLVLPDLPRVACLTDGTVSALISISDENRLVDFDIGGDNLEATQSVTRKLLDGLPDARLQDPAANRAEGEV